MTKRFVCNIIVWCVVSVLSYAQMPSLMPYPKSAFGYSKLQPMLVTSQTMLVIPDTASNNVVRAINYVQEQMQKRLGLSLKIVTLRSYLLSVPPTTSAILFLPQNNPLTKQFIKRIPRGEALSALNGAYILDARTDEVRIYCRDTDESAMYAATTLMQLLQKDARIPAVHIWDYPDYPVRWLFSTHNMLVSSNVSALRSLTDSMTNYKMNGIQQNDFKLSILDKMFARYFNNVDTLKTLWKSRGIEVIPGVCNIGWSSGLLNNDPMLAEGILAKTRYVISNDTGRLIPDDRVSLPNGGFETFTNNKFTGYSFYDPSFSQDKSILRSGSASAKATDFRTHNSAGNARLSRTVQCMPHGYYVMSAYIRTQGVTNGFFQLLAIGGSGAASRSLTFTALDIPSTTAGWQRVEVLFNTLDFTQMTLYVGLWGGSTGTFWVDDFDIRPAGLTNILRRKGTPLVVKNTKSSYQYKEGVDYQNIVDSLYIKNNGEIGPYHTPPVLRRYADAVLRNGDTVEVEYFHPYAAVSGNDGNGSVMVCVGSDSLYPLIANVTRRVKNLFNATSYFMGHDEIRNMNRDSSCLIHNESPASLLSNNLRRCDSIIRVIEPSSRNYVWSDMFDSLHNAQNNYYLINGDLRGIWKTIPKNITIANWNSGEMKASMDFFHRNGFRQITAPYYDSRSPATIRSWRLVQEDIPTCDGMMYTTWANDYSQLAAFGYYSWGAGPYIRHVPLDSSVWNSSSMKVMADILPDPYDNNDAITQCTLVVYATSVYPNIQRIPMSEDKAIWSVTTSIPDTTTFRYCIEAKNKQGIIRRTPDYEVLRRTGNGTTTSAPNEEVVSKILYPNPASDVSTIEAVVDGDWRLMVIDMYGRIVHEKTGNTSIAEHIRYEIPVKDIAQGVYVIRVQTQRRMYNINLIVQH